MAEYMNEREATRNLQKYLRQLGYFDADFPLVPIDGIFESDTRDALMIFQTKNSLPATGVADKETWDALFAEYLASLDPSIFICDYDYNAPSAEHLLATLPPLYRAFREKHPDTPFIFVSSPEMKTGKERHDIVKNTAREAIESGDQNVYFVDGEHMFDEMKPHACTIEGCHPTDLGFYCMAKAIGRVLAPILENFKTT